MAWNGFGSFCLSLFLSIQFPISCSLIQKAMLGTQVDPLIDKTLEVECGAYVEEKQRRGQSEFYCRLGNVERCPKLTKNSKEAEAKMSARRWVEHKGSCPFQPLVLFNNSLRLVFFIRTKNEKHEKTGIRASGTLHCVFECSTKESGTRSI